MACGRPGAVCTPPPCAAVAADLELRAAQGLRGAGAAAPLHGSALLRACPEEQGDENVDRRSLSGARQMSTLFVVFIAFLSDCWMKAVMRNVS